MTGALSLYAAAPHAFGAAHRGQATIFAAYAAHAMTMSQQRDAHGLEAAQLRDALRTRELIGQAQGILMERDRVSADVAFDMLRVASQHLNIKLRDVAQRLIDTGERPE